MLLIVNPHFELSEVLVFTLRELDGAVTLLLSAFSFMKDLIVKFILIVNNEMVRAISERYYGSMR
jgi:hypothetical protein